MPIIKSARKRVKTAQKATLRNAKSKLALKNALKSLSKKPTADAFIEAQSAIDQASKKHVIHKNKAARLKKRAALLAKESGVKLSKKTSPKAKTVKAPAKTKAKSTPKKK